MNPTQALNLLNDQCATIPADRQTHALMVSAVNTLDTELKRMAEVDQVAESSKARIGELDEQVRQAQTDNAALRGRVTELERQLAEARKPEWDQGTDAPAAA